MTGTLTRQCRCDVTSTHSVPTGPIIAYLTNNFADQDL